ncbi:MAG: ligand-binding sensor domain-containing protein, partial [Bacteroidia bacterium]
MKLKPLKKCIAVLVFLLPILLQAQLQRNYTSYTVDNGLAQNTVWDAFQDHRGYMWFGTADGINRFDGYKMHHYGKIDGDSTSLAGTTGFNFFEDNKNQIWIGHDAGLDFYNRVKNKFIRIHKSTFGESIIGQSDDGVIWTIVAGKTINGFSANTLKLLYTIPVNCDWHNSHGSSMSSVKINNTFFIGTSNNIIAQFFPQSRTIKYHFTQLKITNYLQKINDTSFCVFYYDESLLVSVDHHNLPKINFIKQNHPNNNKFYFSCGLTDNNKLYMGGGYGLFVFDVANLKYVKQEILEVRKDEKIQFVQNIVKDRSNNLYICSNGWGLFVFSPYANKFKHYTNLNPQRSLFKAIIKLKNNKVLGGVYGEGFTEFNTDGSFKSFKPNKTKQRETVNAFYPKNSNELWLIYGNRIATLDLLNYKVHLKPNIDTLFVFPFPFFDTINGNLFVNASTANYSILIDVKTSRTVYKFNINNLSCYKQLSDSLLILGASSGLYFYNLNTKKMSSTAIKSFVKQILFYEENEIYLATINGLFLIDTKGNIVKHYTSKNGLVNDFIYALLADRQGNIWFSHNKGISVFNPKQSNFKHYGIKDGLQSNEFNTGAFYKDENGLLYFGGVNGINEINPDKIIENRHPPQIGINEILLGDIPYQTDTAYNEIQSLNLTYLDNTLSFDFSALEFSQPEQNTYQYFLEGYDKNWIQSGTKHFARYANLPPGEYVFKIKAANGDGYWNESPRELFISIKPPFWKTTWFYFLMFLLGISVLSLSAWLFVKRQKRNLKRAFEVQRKLEEERLRISRDLHDNVGAQLSYLITNIEWMLQHPEQMSDAEEKQRLNALSDAGKNAILTLRQTIWAISHTSLMVDDFADRFKQFVLKMIEFNKTIQVQFAEDLLSP